MTTFVSSGFKKKSPASPLEEQLEMDEEYLWMNTYLLKIKPKLLLSVAENPISVSKHKY